MIWLTVASVALGSAFAIGVPLFQNPDEPSHVDRVRHQASHPFDIPGSDLRMQRTVVKASERVGLVLGYHQGWPPELDERAPQPRFSDHEGADRPACPSCQSYQYAHPPAYYWLAAPLSAAAGILPADLHVLLLRLLSVIIAAPLPWLTWWAAKEVAPHHGGAGTIAAAFAALNGPVTAATSAVNNDALAYVASAGVIALSASALRHGLTARRATALGACVALAGLTKVTALPVALVGGVLLLVAPGTVTVTRRVSSVALAAVGALWWLRNLATEGRLTPGGTELFDASLPRRDVSESYLEYLFDQLGLLLHRALGLYGWAQALVPVVAAQLALGAAVALVLIWAVTRARRWPGRMLVLAVAPILAVITTVASSYGNFTRTGAVTGLSGRYLYPAAPVIWLAAATAVAAILGRIPRLPSPGAVVVSLTGLAGIASLAFCLIGLYETTGVRTMTDRMHLTAPLTFAAPAVVLLAAVAVAAAVMAGSSLRRQTDAEPAVGG